MARWVAVVFIFPASLCLHYAYLLASRGLGGWGWFLFVSLVFWGVVLNAMTGQAMGAGYAKPPIADDGLE